MQDAFQPGYMKTTDMWGYFGSTHEQLSQTSCFLNRKGASNTCNILPWKLKARWVSKDVVTNIAGQGAGNKASTNRARISFTV